jgi:hypothetical protein
VSKNAKHILFGLAALSAGAAAIHFAVTSEHFKEYLMYGVFFLVTALAQMIWASIAVWRLPRWWLWLGVAGNTPVLAVYLASRTTGLPFGPDPGHAEPFGALDVLCALLELALIGGCAALLWRPSLIGRPGHRSGYAAGRLIKQTDASLASFRTETTGPRSVT